MKNGQFYREARAIYHNLKMNDTVTTSKNVRNALYKYSDRQLKSNGYRFTTKMKKNIVTVKRIK